MPYRSPVADILFSLSAVADLPGMIGQGLAGDLDWDAVSSIVGEAGRFATEEIAPLNRPGDLAGARYENGVVTTPPGFADAYRRWAEAGWDGVSAPAEFGGMGLPHLVNVACTEIWNGAVDGLCALSAVDRGRGPRASGLRLARTARRLSRRRWSAGRWTGTMNLTEPQAGSDLNAVRTRAERADDGTYRLFGQKIFITYGEHDMAENIVHLVLARLPGAPPGTRGLSLFLAPKFLVNADGSLGARNDLRCAGIEHKLGIHALADLRHGLWRRRGREGLARRRGEPRPRRDVRDDEHRAARGRHAGRGDRRARLSAGARLRARAPPGPRAEGGDGMSPIIEHADVQRMLMTMKANVQAARGICHLTGVALDLAAHAQTEGERTAAANRAALLTPIAKAFSTDIGDEAASLGVQVHGGMGYIEETGAAQHMRDSRIAAIYEGANGIQAIDLVQRKLPLADGETVREEIAGIRAVAGDVAGRGGAGFGATAARLAEAADALEEATRLMLRLARSRPGRALAGASPYLRLFGLTLGGACLAKAGLAAQALAAERRRKRARARRPRPLLRRETRRSPRRGWRAPSRRAARRWNPTRRSWRRAHDGTLERRIEVARDGAVLSAAFARPQKKNAITGAMYEALIEAFEAAEREPSVGALVLSGKGGVFTAGNDIGDFLAGAHARDAANFRPGGSSASSPSSKSRWSPRSKGWRSASERRSASIAISSMPRPTRASRCRSSISASCRRRARRCWRRSASGARRRRNLSCSPRRSTPRRRCSSASSTRSSPQGELCAHAMAKAAALAAKPRAALLATRRLMRGDPEALKARMAEEMHAFSAALE